jgi:hypothetical protein
MSSRRSRPRSCQLIPVARAASHFFRSFRPRHRRRPLLCHSRYPRTRTVLCLKRHSRMLRRGPCGRTAASCVCACLGVVGMPAMHGMTAKSSARRALKGHVPRPKACPVHSLASNHALQHGRGEPGFVPVLSRSLEDERPSSEDSRSRADSHARFLDQPVSRTMPQTKTTVDGQRALIGCGAQFPSP